MLKILAIIVVYMFCVAVPGIYAVMIFNDIKSKIIPPSVLESIFLVMLWIGMLGACIALAVVCTSYVV